METEQLSVEIPLGQGRNKDFKDFQVFNDNKCTTYPNLRDRLTGKFYNTNCLPKEFGDISY